MGGVGGVAQLAVAQFPGKSAPLVIITAKPQLLGTEIPAALKANY
jgi:hypothetical protein